jgi:hypothetical protein
MREVEIGKHYFFRRTKRVDQFAHKRYSSVELDQWSSILFMGKAIETRRTEVKIEIFKSGMRSPDPADGKVVVVPIGTMLVADDGEYLSLESHGRLDAELGKWTT